MGKKEKTDLGFKESGVKAKTANWRGLAVAGVVALFLVAGLLPGIREPFWGHHEFNGVFYSMIAHNYNRYGWLATKGAQVTNFARADSGEWSLHTHHSATYPLVLSAWYRIWGEGETQARFLSVGGSLVAAFGLAFLAQRIARDKRAGLVVLALATTPLWRYYGKMPVFEPLLLPLVSLGILSYWHKRDQSSEWTTPLLAGLAFLLDWPGFWLGFWLLTYEIVRTRRWPVVRNLALAMGASLLVILAHQYVTTGSALDEFLRVGQYRLGVSEQPYTSGEWVRLLLNRARAFWGWPLIFTSGIGLMVAWKSREKRELVILTGLIGISHIVVFRHIAWYHDYMLYHLIPWVVVLLALVWEESIKRMPVTVLVLGWGGILLLNLAITGRFYQDLEAMEPHRICVQLGEAKRRGERVSYEALGDEGKSICAPFIGYYSLMDPGFSED